jgi:hypothetical protein
MILEREKVVGYPVHTWVRGTHATLIFIMFRSNTKKMGFLGFISVGQFSYF